jgi:EAL domain-containing protein (putative c-di-GMP-specific phosphodiesterase class I)
LRIAGFPVNIDSMERSSTDGLNGRPLAVAEPAANQPASNQALPIDAMRWELSGNLTPNAPLQRVVINTQPFTVGRDPESSLHLPNPTISRRHAELMVAGNDLMVRDLASRNGTFLNGRRVRNFERLTGGDMLQFGAAIFTVHPQDARPRSLPLHEQCLTAVEVDICDFALANLEFERLLTDPAIFPHYQPIVRLDTNERVGYEVLARSRLIGLETPNAMFRVAVERNLEAELSDVIRRESLRTARQMALNSELFLNTHPAELHRPIFIESLERLRREFPEAGIVIEIHESAITSSQTLADLRARLKDLNMRLAYDDFGAGQSRLMELADVPPDVLKFDRHLIHGLSCASEERQNMVRSLVQIVRGLNVIPLAEGIETGDEAVICRELGFELAQGYYFGRPAAAPDRPVPKTARITGRPA